MLDNCIDGYAINSEKIDSEILCVVTREKGFSRKAIYWYIEYIDDITVLIWNTSGHMGSSPDCDPELLSVISAWLN